MNGTHRIAGALLVSSLIGACSSGGGAAVARKSEPAVAPGFRGETLKGSTEAFDPRALRRPILFTFWASWCTSCREELPALIELYERERERIDIIGVNVDKDAEQARGFAESERIPYVNFVDRELRVSDLFDVKKTPTFIVVDRRGRIRFNGQVLDGDLYAALEEALK